MIFFVFPILLSGMPVLRENLSAFDLFFLLMLFLRPLSVVFPQMYMYDIHFIMRGDSSS